MSSPLRPSRPRPRALLLVAGLVLAGACHGERAKVHWPRSAGAITPDDPADDGGESLAPRRVDEAAAVEHGGDDLTIILDEPSPVPAAPAPAPKPAASSAEPALPALPPEGIPVFEDTIIVQ